MGLRGFPEMTQHTIAFAIYGLKHAKTIRRWIEEPQVTFL